jgi:hypothetical protein
MRLRRFFQEELSPDFLSVAQGSNFLLGRPKEN